VQVLELLTLGNVVCFVNIATKQLLYNVLLPIPLTGGFRDATMSVCRYVNDGDIDAVVSSCNEVYVWDIQDTSSNYNAFQMFLI
jgi:hypothetical protein